MKLLAKNLAPTVQPGQRGGYYSGKRRKATAQSDMSLAVHRRDKTCVFSGATAGLKAAHIVGLEDVARLSKETHYSPSCAILMRSYFEETYDRNEWYFTPKGEIVILRDTCCLKDELKAISKVA